MKTNPNEAGFLAGAEFFSFLSRCVGALALGLLALAAMSVAAAPVETNRAAISFDQIGAAAQKQYTGDGLSIAQGSDGVCLRCVFQKMAGRVTSQGLWLTSTAGRARGVPFRVVARSVGREHDAATPLPGTGEVQTTSQMARFHRAGLDEEYDVSVDGVRQDFVVTARPAGHQALRVELAVDGARVEAAPDGARLILDGSGRKLAYNRLKVTDVQGCELTTRMEVVSPGQLAVVVDDAAAVYPVRIDPTFTDANWVSFGGLLGANGEIYTTVVDTNGNLYVGGTFTIIGTVFANYIAKWDGTNWSALGAGMNGEGLPYPSVNSLALDGSGNLYAGGWFMTAGGVNATNIAKWNGSAWSALGSGMTSATIDPPIVYSLACDSSGNLYAGGYFGKAGGVFASLIAKWDGSAWSALSSGTGDATSSANSLAFDRSGNLFAGGGFTTAGTNVSACLAEALLSQSSYNLALTKIGTGTNIITGLGTPNYTYALDLATNLAPPVNWMPQATNTLIYQSFVFTNTSASPQGFYRTRYVP